MVKKYLSLLLVILVNVTLVKAQHANVRGFVYTKDNGEPALFTNVYLKGTTYGAATDINGFFNITKVKPGSYTLVASYLGYDSIFETITVKGDEIVRQKKKTRK